MNIFNKHSTQVKEYCLIGLNKFTHEIGKILSDEGNKVTIIDKDKTKIDDFGDQFHRAIVADAKNIKQLSDIGIQFFDYVIVGAANLESSVVIAANLKELNVKNTLFKAKNESHKKILKLLGIKIIYIPETEVATKISYKIMYNLSVELFSFDKRDTLVMKIPLLNTSLWGKKVSDIPLPKPISATIISIKQKDGTVLVPVVGKNILQAGDIICLICKKTQWKKIRELFEGKSNIT